jgi:hypothetical protein
MVKPKHNAWFCLNSSEFYGQIKRPVLPSAFFIYSDSQNNFPIADYSGDFSSPRLQRLSHKWMEIASSSGNCRTPRKDLGNHVIASVAKQSPSIKHNLIGSGWIYENCYKSGHRNKNPTSDRRRDSLQVIDRIYFSINIFFVLSKLWVFRR